MNQTNRDFTDQIDTGHRAAAPASNLFREWQHADAQASAARRRVRNASVADGHGLSDADVCDALVKERRAGLLAEQLLQRFGASRTTRDGPHAR